MNPFPFYPGPMDGESLSSYLQRFSKENGVKPHELWRHLLVPGQHYPQTSFSASLNYLPENVINVRFLAEAASLSEEQVHNMTFRTVLAKCYGIDQQEQMRSSRMLSTIREDFLKFCPHCIKEKGYHRLIWQVKEVAICPEHRIELINNCPVCNRPVPFLARNSEINICPSCHGSLSDVQTTPIKQDASKQVRIIEDWMYLFNLEARLIPKIDGLDNKEALAVALLYVAGGKVPEFNKSMILQEDVNRSIIPLFLQSARGTRSRSAFIHMGTVLSLLRLKGLTCSEFSQLQIPDMFVQSVLGKKKNKYENYACKAPWCDSYGKSGSLEKTGTSTKITKGKHLNYYMRCRHCLSDYAVDASTGELVERGYFISLGWHKVRQHLLEGEGVKNIAKKLGETIGSVSRCSMHLVANRLLPEHVCKKYFPHEVDPTAQDFIMSQISCGRGIKEIWKEKDWSYKELLYYWFLPVVRRARSLYEDTRLEGRGCLQERERLVKGALDELLNSQIPITVSKVSSLLNVCPETIRQWGLLPMIKEYKNRQKEELRDKKLEWMNKADRVIEELELERKEIVSAVVYEKLGVRRTVLVRNFPDATAYIKERLFNIRKEKQQEKLRGYALATENAVSFRLIKSLTTSQADIAAEIGLSLSGFRKHQILVETWREAHEMKLPFGFTASSPKIKKYTPECK